MSRLLGIGACQISSINYEVEENLKQFEAHVEKMKSLSPWLNLVVTNELGLIGNVSDPSLVLEEIPGPITEFCSNLARKHGIYIIPGSIYEKVEGGFYNTSPIINPDGEIIAVYRKMYPWRPFETSKSGNQTVVFNIPGIGTIGIAICYDIWFPELIRDLTWKGAEVILHPTATYTADRAKEHILCRAAAIVNQCYVVDINGSGDSGIGMSMIVDPEGNVQQSTGQTGEIMMAALDLDQVSQTRKFGTCSTAQVLGSYIHEQHQYDCYRKKVEESELSRMIKQPTYYSKLD